MLVSISYRLFDAAGALADEVPAHQPLSYIDGYGQLIFGLCEGLRGAKPGDTRSISLDPEQAFGTRDEQARLEIFRHDFPDADAVELGDELLATAPDGQEAAYRVVEISPETIVADLNHPLAGQRVRFEVKVLAIRPASDEELDAACRDIDELIVYNPTIVYGSEPGVAAEAAASPSQSPPQLVQLRRPSGRHSASDQPRMNEEKS